jgi:hypothetical protein
MISNYFSIAGYLSIALWLVVPILWLVHAVRRPRRWICHYAVIVAVAALFFATINSKTYVNRIQIDRSEEIAAAQARQAAARKAAEQSRAGEVAQVRFAEDGASDFLDEGGMDDADKKYMATFDESVAPDWKKEKKARSQTSTEDDSLEAMLDTSREKEEGMATEAVEGSVAEPIMMPEKQMMLANRLDGYNLKLIRWLILIGLGVVVVDYLKRVNCYNDAYFPLPLPSRWANSLTPAETVQTWLSTSRRTIQEELAWLAQRGDTFLYVTDDEAAAAQLPEQLWRLSRPERMPMDIIHVTADNAVDDDFVFETLWYGRSSFVVDSAARAESLLARMMELLGERKASRAQVRQNVNVIWDLETPLAEETLQAFERLGQATGLVLVTKAG